MSSCPLTLLEGSPAIEAYGEPLRLWKSEASQCAALVAFWSLVQGRNRSELQKYVFYPPGRSEKAEVFFAWKDGHLSVDQRRDVDWRTPTYTWQDLNEEDPSKPIVHKESEVVAGGSSENGGYFWELLTRGHRRKPDVIEVARLYLYQQISAKLQGRVSPMLRLERPAATSLLFYAHSLLGAVFLSFAIEMTGRKAPSVPCQNPRCTNPLLTDHRRRRYCSDYCRVQHYRDRERSKAN